MCIWNGYITEAEVERLRDRVAELEQWAADKPEAERRWLETAREVERLREELREAHDTTAALRREAYELSVYQDEARAALIQEEE